MLDKKKLLSYLFGYVGEGATARIITAIELGKFDSTSYEKDIAEADGWCEYWRREAFRKYPTPDAYDAVCAALEKHRARADAAEKQRDGLIQALRDGFADDVQFPTKADLLYWITSTCPWLEGQFSGCNDCDGTGQIWWYEGDVCVGGDCPSCLKAKEIDDAAPE